jgi:hypothetical protein
MEMILSPKMFGVSFSILGCINGLIGMSQLLILILQVTIDTLFLELLFMCFGKIEIVWCSIGSLDNQLLLISNQASFIISSSNCSVDSQSHSIGCSIEISWTPPPHDHYRINIDGSHKKSLRISTYGGLIRDSHGKFVCYFYNRLECCYALWAKL